MATVLDRKEYERLEDQRLAKERSKIDSYTTKFQGNREKIREQLNKDRINVFAIIYEELNKSEVGAETVQWEEIIELKGFKIDRTRDPLGEGKFSQIYKAHWNHHAKEVAVKVLRSKELATALEIKDFNKHIKILMHFNHPKIVKCIKCFLVSNTNKLYIFMQLAPYGTVQDVIVSKKKPIPLAQAKSWTKDALEALSYLHALGVAHRKVMPINLLLHSSNSCTKLVLPEYYYHIGETDKQGRSLGGKCKPVPEGGPYTPPEAVFNATYDPIPGDIWALGCTLYYMLVMKPPFTNCDNKTGFKEELETQRWQYCGIVDKSPKLDEASKQFLIQIFQQQPEKRPTASETFINGWFKG